MKKHFYLFIFLSAFTFSSEAQKSFRAGLKAGISTSQVEGDTYGGFNKVGFNGGATITAKLNNKWDAQFEILFAQKGSKHVGDVTKGDYSYYKMQLNYVEVPLLLRYKQKKFTFEAGPGFAYLINEKEYNEYGVLDYMPPFYKTEINASIGINYSIYKNLGVDWRFTNSISSIRGHHSVANTLYYDAGERNNVITFTLTYIFGSAESQ